MNKVILMGRLTRDPEVRYSQGERPIAVARYTLAVNRTFKRAGEPDADFINCVTFGRSAEFAEFIRQILSWRTRNLQRVKQPAISLRRLITAVRQQHRRQARL